jgi:hypothetical protein
MQNARRTLWPFLNEFARRECFPQIAEERCLLLDVFVAEQGCDGKGGFFAVVERNAAGSGTLV